MTPENTNSEVALQGQEWQLHFWKYMLQFLFWRVILTCISSLTVHFPKASAHTAWLLNPLTSSVKKKKTQKTWQIWRFQFSKSSRTITWVRHSASWQEYRYYETGHCLDPTVWWGDWHERAKCAWRNAGSLEWPQPSMEWERRQGRDESGALEVSLRGWALLLAVSRHSGFWERESSG